MIFEKLDQQHAIVIQGNGNLVKFDSYHSNCRGMLVVDMHVHVHDMYMCVHANLRLKASVLLINLQVSVRVH